MSLQGRIALITGGGSGIGAACCRALADEGATAIAADINLEAAQSVASAISESGGHAVAMALDVTQEAQWASVAEQLDSKFGQLDVLVNNAGIVTFGTVEDESLETWRQVMAVNVEGTFLGIRECMKLMRTAGGGSVINLSSVAGITADAQTPAYNASKGAVRLLTKSAALHGANMPQKIRVNSVHPGYVATPMTANLGDLAEGDYDDVMKARIPLGYVCGPEEIANAVVFLASDKARYITGSELIVDGGFTAW